MVMDVHLSEVADTGYGPVTDGGWWQTQSVTSIMHRMGTTATRLILPFTSAMQLEFTYNADSSLDRTVPPPLAARGVTQEEWNDIVAELVLVQRSTLGVCTTMLMLTLCVTAPLICLVRWRHQARLQRWLRHINSAYLQPRGMLAKLQTAKDYRTMTAHEQVVSWLAIALTPDECAQLAAEPSRWCYSEKDCANPNIGTMKADSDWGCFELSPPLPL